MTNRVSGESGENQFERINKITEWEFCVEVMGSDRVRLLQHVCSYSEISQRITAEMNDIKYRPKEGCKEAKNKIRAEFFFNICPETLDLFFNSSEGYRAQYYSDPERGVECNRFLIDLVKDKLVEFAVQSNQHRMTIERIKKSINYGSAKIWIDEDNSTLDQTNRDKNKIVALEIPRWTKAMEQVLAAWSEHKQPNPTIKIRSLLGVQAPEGSRLEVLGAWLDDNDQEFVVPSKVERAKHIHDYGFS